MTIECPKCHADNPDTLKFCGECGTSLIYPKGISLTKTLHSPSVSLGKIFAGKYKIIEEIGRGGGIHPETVLHLNTSREVEGGVGKATILHLILPFEVTMIKKEYMNARMLIYNHVFNCSPVNVRGPVGGSI